LFTKGDRDYSQHRQGGGGGYDDYQRPYRTGANAYGAPGGDSRGGYGGPGGYRGQPGDEGDSIQIPQTAVGLIIGKGTYIAVQVYRGTTVHVCLIRW
jgi:hypothetical protein